MATDVINKFPITTNDITVIRFLWSTSTIHGMKYFCNSSLDMGWAKLLSGETFGSMVYIPSWSN